MKNRITAVLICITAASLYACDDNSSDIEALIKSQSSVSLVNYLGNSQNIHPKVLYFNEPYGGHRFWMAYTPYPDGKINCENPCIAVSDDGYTWHDPEGCHNPLATAPKYGYNSDTHLIFNPADNSLECWWREYDIKGKRDRLLRRISTDGGKSWSVTGEVLPFGSAGDMRLSPAVVIRDGHYEMMYCDGSRLFIVKSDVPAPDVHWGADQEIKINVPGLNAWHLDFIMRDHSLATAVICCYEEGGNNNSADLYICDIDLDEAVSTTPRMLLARSHEKGSTTERSIYRSSIVDVDGTDYLYYSSIDQAWHRHLDLMILDNVY